jgi:hypothetical protein
MVLGAPHNGLSSLLFFHRQAKGNSRPFSSMLRSSVAMVQISAAETVFRIWSGSGQKGQGQNKKSGSDPNILDPTRSGFLTLSRTQKGLFKNLCGQKNGQILFRIAKKVSRMDQNFLKINIIFYNFFGQNFCWRVLATLLTRQA